MQSINVTQNNHLFGFQPNTDSKHTLPCQFPSYSTSVWNVDGIAANNSWRVANVLRHADGL